MRQAGTQITLAIITAGVSAGDGAPPTVGTAAALSAAAEGSQ